MMKRKAKTEITDQQLIEIIGEDWKDFQKILNNCYCSSCRDNYLTTIIDYKVFVDDLKDVVLKGKCKKCGGPVNRHIETGEEPKDVKRIQSILGKSIYE